MTQRKYSNSEKALITFRQQIDGVEAAMMNRPFRPLKGMWKSGGKIKEGAERSTVYEIGYRSWSRGVDLALANRALSARDQRNDWVRRAYYATLTILDRVADAVTTQPISTPVLPPRLDDALVSPKKAKAEKAKATQRDRSRMAVTGPKHGEPSHEVLWTNDYKDDGAARIRVSDDGKTLIVESLKRHGGDPVWSDSEPLTAKRQPWARYYWNLLKAQPHDEPNMIGPEGMRDELADMPADEREAYVAEYPEYAEALALLKAELAEDTPTQPSPRPAQDGWVKVIKVTRGQVLDEMHPRVIEWYRVLTEWIDAPNGPQPVLPSDLPMVTEETRSPIMVRASEAHLYEAAPPAHHAASADPD